LLRKIGWFQLYSNSNENRLRIVLPRGARMALAGRVGVGESVAELGGLTLSEVDLELGFGDHRLGFSEPTPSPLQVLELDASSGDLELHGIGNASPRWLVVDHGVGELRLDLRGAWREDAELRIGCGIGPCVVQLPEAVHLDFLEFLDAGAGSRDTAVPADAPRLRGEIRDALADLEVVE
jgi:hypothetical protein